MLRKIALTTFNDLKNYFSFDEYLKKRFRTSFTKPESIKQATREIAEMKALGFLSNKKADPHRLQKNLRYFNPQGMRYTKLNKVGDVFTRSEISKKVGITSQTIKKWINLGYIVVIKTTKTDTTYQKTLIWYKSQSSPVPSRFYKTITATVVSVDSEFVVTKIAGMSVKREKSMADLKFDAMYFTLSDNKVKLRKTSKKAASLLSRTLRVTVPSFWTDFREINWYDRIVVKGIK